MGYEGDVLEQIRDQIPIPVAIQSFVDEYSVGYSPQPLFPKIAFLSLVLNVSVGQTFTQREPVGE